MSAYLFRASDSSGNNASLQGSAVGGIKPLHRFIKGQPKINGIIALVLGSSFFLIAIAVAQENSYLGWTGQAVFFQGTMFIICGILYILTEHNPTKKTVTISLALSILTVITVCWTLLGGSVYLVANHQRRIFRISDVNDTRSPCFTSEDMEHEVEVIFLLHTVLGGVMFIVMSCLAVASLRSTKSQAIVLMTTAADVALVE
ncbi:uncharacterized protein AB9W97_011417 isoform 1-T3 [Spinachia spinachia]